MESENKKIYDYIKNYGQREYKINYNIFDSVYVLIASLIEADYSKNSGKGKRFLKIFDFQLTKNINILQEDEKINHDPMKTPIISEILTIINPSLDKMNFYYSLHKKLIS